MSQQINLYEDRLRPRLELATGRNLSMSALLLLLLMGAWSYQSSLDASRKAFDRGDKRRAMGFTCSQPPKHGAILSRTRVDLC